MKSNGNHAKPAMPSPALGTFMIDDAIMNEVLDMAYMNGYRHFDCAMFYKNEPAVGQALASLMKERQVPRSELFLSTKVWVDAIIAGPHMVRKSIEKSLEDLTSGFENEQDRYLDVVYIHWPVSGHREAYRAICTMMDEPHAKVRGIALSNYLPSHLEEISDLMNTGHLPLCNQLEINPLIFDKEAIEATLERGISVMVYKPLGRGGALGDERIIALANSIGCQPSEMILGWLAYRGFILNVKSVNEGRMKNNYLSVTRPISLDDDTIRSLESLGGKDAVVEANRDKILSAETRLQAMNTTEYIETGVWK